MSTERSVESHYAHGRLTEAIANALAALGKSPETVVLDDLGPVDEFHIGGRQATEELTDRLGLARDRHVLDIGCGLGGASRFIGDRYGCRVSGIDLTADYIEAARNLTAWVGLNERLTFHHGSALDMPFDDAGFDAAVMLHVGMNIADKRALFGEVARVLRPGAVFGVYDVMTTGDGELIYPVPWAAEPSTSALATPEAYKAALRESGFELTAERDRRDFAIAFFHKLIARAAQSGGPPPLGLHIVMGADTASKVANMLANIEAGHVAPVELIARLTPR